MKTSSLLVTKQLLSNRHLKERGDWIVNKRASLYELKQRHSQQASLLLLEGDSSLKQEALTARHIKELRQLTQQNIDLASAMQTRHHQDEVAWQRDWQRSLLPW